VMEIFAPYGVHAQLQPPREWALQGPGCVK
jgi:hypothetical protein